MPKESLGNTSWLVTLPCLKSSRGFSLYFESSSSWLTFLPHPLPRSYPHLLCHMGLSHFLSLLPQHLCICCSPNLKHPL